MAEKNKKGYKVVVQGDYYASAPGHGKMIKRYKIEVMLPSMDRALSVIKNKVLQPLLKNKISDYLSFRTYEIVSYEPVGGAESPSNIPVHVMNRPELVKYIKDEGLPVKAVDFIEVQDLRDAILYAVQDPVGYEKKFTEKKADAAENKALKDLNPGITEAGANVEDLTQKEKPGDSGGGPRPETGKDKGSNTENL